MTTDDNACQVLASGRKRDLSGAKQRLRANKSMWRLCAILWLFQHKHDLGLLHASASSVITHNNTFAGLVKTPRGPTPSKQRRRQTQNAYALFRSRFAAKNKKSSRRLARRRLQNVIDPNTLHQKVLAGYQGWFSAPGDGGNNGWRHWSFHGKTPSPESVKIDYWPDLREYKPRELFETEFKVADGSPARLFSSRKYITVRRHFRWMKEYGIDGVFVQRFVSETVHIPEFRDKVLDNARRGAEKHGRVFANMYDISGHDGNIVRDIISDWKRLIDEVKITSSPSYLHHEGRPVLAIWGFGVEGRRGNPAQATRLITWLTTKAPRRYRVMLMGGVDGRFRTRSSQEWLDAFARFDILSPWTVGRYTTLDEADKFRQEVMEGDMEWTSSHTMDYMPVVFPGFSWHNLKQGQRPLNQIPRQHGRFFWRQCFHAVDVGAQMMYVAMFDEVDEGTAIFKVAEDASQLPTTGTFVTLDVDGKHVPSDFYLRLTGEASRMMRQERKLRRRRPFRLK